MRLSPAIVSVAAVLVSGLAVHARTAGETSQNTPHSQAAALIEAANAAAQAHDAAKARALFAKAAATGDAEAMNGYAGYLVNGWGGPQDYKGGIALFERAIAGGSKVARINLANRLITSKNSGDQARAVELALSTENEPLIGPLTDYVIGRAALFGLGGRPRDLALGVTLLERSLTHDGAGNYDALYLVARAYQNGWGGTARDPAKAYDLFLRAAKMDDPRAQRYLGMALLNGEGVTQDKAQAYRWFKKSADAGYRDAMIDVAAMLSTGEGGVTVDPALARTLYLKAAQQGSAYGLQGIGCMLLDGEGGAIDAAAGRAYLELAAEAGNRPAKQLMQMSQFQAPEALRPQIDKIKADWLARYPIVHSNDD